MLAKFVNSDPTNTTDTPGERSDIHEMTLKTKDQTITILFHDTSGQEPNSIPTQFYKGASGAILVYDITSRSSFEGVKAIAKRFREECADSDNIVLVGNKADLSGNR